jgi:hypothetical protein
MQTQNGYTFEAKGLDGSVSIFLKWSRAKTYDI